MALYGNYKAVETLGARFKRECLIERRSLLTGETLWIPEVFQELYLNYNENLDESDRRFDEKVLDQLSGASSQAWQLFGELYVLDLLVLGNLNPQTKIDKVNGILEHCTPPMSLDGEDAPKGAADIVRTFETGGVLNGGQGFSAFRWKQMQYLIDFGVKWTALSMDVRIDGMSSAEHINRMVYELADTREPQIMRAVAYLFAPEGHVAITSGGHLNQIIKYFGQYLTDNERDLTPQQQAWAVRDRIRDERGPDWDFYDDPDEWNVTRKRTRKEAAVVESDVVLNDDVDITDAWDTVETEFELPYFPGGSDESLLVGQDWLDDFHRLLSRKKQVIFQGPPGTGKTYLARRMAVMLAGSAERVALVQFHPAYTYEDFFEGFRPSTEGGLELTQGPLRKLAERADEEPTLPFFLVIDEMNRGNLARIFGELYFLLEYRNQKLDLMYSQEEFALPQNLFIIGTMNTADRSIALVDLAMRRRFGFMRLDPGVEPTSDLLARWCEQEDFDNRVVQVWLELNRRIESHDPELMLGPSYFMRPWVYETGGLEDLWRTEIIPQLRESFYGREASVLPELSLKSIRTDLGL